MQRAGSLRMLQVRGKLMVGILVVQYLIGMVLDLFIHLPKIHPGTIGGYFTRVGEGFLWSIGGSGSPALAAHVIIATGLVLGAITTLVFSVSAHNKVWIIAASVGFVGIVLAWLNGIEFINTGLDQHSFAMAIAFMIALVSYGAGLYYAKQHNHT